MASKFVIREKNSGYFCTGQKFRTFSYDLNEAALFDSKKNAEKAIKGMFPSKSELTPYGYGGKMWSLAHADGKSTVFLHNMRDNLISLMESLGPLHASRLEFIREHVTERACEMEVVEVKLVLC